METKLVNIPAIGCAGCVRTIENEIGAMDGVKLVKGEVDSKQVKLEWDAPASWESIRAKLNEIEYAPAEA